MTPGRPAARLYGLGTAAPSHAAKQVEIHRFMSRVLGASGEMGALKLLERLYESSGIERRHSVLPDYSMTEPSSFEFYPQNWALEPFPGTARRMEVFEASSVALAERAARSALAQGGFSAGDVTHLVLTTCTGLFAPGPDILLIGRLGLKPDVQRTLLGFMGCYAGLTAMKLAGDLVASQPAAVVLVDSVELCTLHFQKRPTPDFLVANSLFADGAGSAVFAAPGARPGGLGDLAAAFGRVAPESREQMSWRVGDTGFEMRLDRAVPKTLERHAPAFVADLLTRAGLSREDSPRWAPHPGGKGIVSALAECLRLDAGQTASARGVLSGFGNMSSATIFFVLAAEFARGGGPLVALGFGPGLTMEGAVFVPPR
ncbi:MAG: chalcone synthase [Elusimicrobia bacterium]|nr:MAG: chalcone synthase [Elusimicrobiota bacterium]